MECSIENTMAPIANKTIKLNACSPIHVKQRCTLGHLLSTLNPKWWMSKMDIVPVSMAYSKYWTARSWSDLRRISASFGPRHMSI